MIQAQKSLLEEFIEKHPEKDGWHIINTGTRLIAFKNTGNNYFIVDRIKKVGKEWRELSRITGRIRWYGTYDKNCSFSTFFEGLSSACKTVEAHIKSGTLKIENPLSKRLNRPMLAAVVIEELIPMKIDPDGMIDLAYLLFTSNITNIVSIDGRRSMGVFQTLPKTHESIRERYPSFNIPPFKKCDTYEEQAVVAILLAYENLATFNKQIFSKSEKLRSVWDSSTEKERKDFTAFVVAAMHNAPRSTLRAFRRALKALANKKFTLSSLSDSVAKRLNPITKSFAGTGEYASRVVKLYNGLCDRGFSNFPIYAEQKLSSLTPTKVEPSKVKLLKQ